MTKFNFHAGDIVSEDGIDYTIVDINENVVTLADPNDEDFEVPYDELEDLVDLDDSDEDDGQLDELKKSTLANYIVKRSQQLGGVRLGRKKTGPGRIPSQATEYKKAYKYSKGIRMAKNKFQDAKEEVGIEDDGHNPRGKFNKTSKGINKSTKLTDGKRKGSLNITRTEGVEEDVKDITRAQASMHAQSDGAGRDPKSKVEWIYKIVGAISGMPETKLEDLYNKTLVNFGHYGDGVPGGADNKNEGSIRAKPSDALGHGPMKMAKEDLEVLFKGNDLSEEFKEDATAIFEAAVNSRVIMEVEEVKALAESQIEEQVEEITSTLVEQLDSYLNYVVEEWLEENAVAIESTLRNEIMEDFLFGLRELFAENYMNVPEEQVNVVDALAEELEELKENYNEVVNENITLSQNLIEAATQDVFDDLSEGLTDVQAEKLATLAEGIEYDNNVDVFAKKLKIIKENYFGNKKAKATYSTNVLNETFEEETGDEPMISSDPVVNQYADFFASKKK